ncbi:MAG: stage V sporulation protein AD, partial [Oscillospiraceae bacterium]
MAKKIGKSTFIMENMPSAIAFAAVASKKEASGPLAKYFDILCDDTTFGEQTWEKAESRMQKDAANKALEKASLCQDNLDLILAGDLLNQCTGSTFGLRDFGVPYLGVYGACSTMAETIAISSLFIDATIIKKALAVTSSHFCTAERQYRFPLEYGGVRPSTSQWTVTGAGAVILGENSMPPYIKAVSIGTIQDKGIKDANNMGAAMSPGAAETIKQFFIDTMTDPSNYDMIITGDLGIIGSELLIELLKEDGYDISKNHADCGVLIYDIKEQDVHSGGSGCGCSATVLTSYILPSIRKGELNEVLFIATGALLSTT